MAGIRFEINFARRITFKGQRSISGLVVKLAVISIAVAVAVMEVVLSVVYGFQGEIHRKVMGFGSHIQVGVLLKELDSRQDPLDRFGYFVEPIRRTEGVASVSPFVELPSMIKSKTTQEGILMKGVDKNYDWSFFSNSLIEGTLPDFSDAVESNQILISKKLAQLLRLEVGKSAYVYFFKDQNASDTLILSQQVEIRKVKVSGIYETGMEEFDRIRVICDMRLLQIVLKLPGDKVSGFEINLTDPGRLEELTGVIKSKLPPTLNAYPITQLYPEIFEWVALQHQNVWFILTLMIIIALINMTGVVLILILERAQMIGLLKALGLSNGRVMGIFIFNAYYLILLGVLAGNLIGFAIIWSQDQFGWCKVDQASYFIHVVPVTWHWLSFALVNLGVILVCTLFMILPATLISRISPGKAIRFD